MEPMAIFEYGTLLAGSPLMTLVPAGDGHPVLVLPGFGASDRSTAPLRAVLTAYGHSAHGWQLGSNVGPHPRILFGVRRRLVQLYEHFDQKVSLVGWSLGGIYARELARENPGLVRQVITLASPFRLRPGDRTRASAFYDRLGPVRSPFPAQTVEEHERPDLPVPSTSIYTRTDGVVRWHLCAETAGPRRENIEVIGTHSGLGNNIAAVLSIADRLAQDPGRWAKFRPPPVLAHWYPPPIDWVPPARPRSA
jgi:pimeloyl-ACP methyl ester carboxylesterase